MGHCSRKLTKMTPSMLLSTIVCILRCRDAVAVSHTAVSPETARVRSQVSDCHVSAMAIVDASGSVPEFDDERAALACDEGRHVMSHL